MKCRAGGSAGSVLDLVQLFRFETQVVSAIASDPEEQCFGKRNSNGRGSAARTSTAYPKNKVVWAGVWVRERMLEEGRGPSVRTSEITVRSLPLPPDGKGWWEVLNDCSWSIM